jgi:ribA/ribD-fused uncharacterized protein
MPERIEFRLEDEAFGFLSNFYYFPITWQGKVWSGSEFIYQARKNDDPVYQEWIRNSHGPAQARKKTRIFYPGKEEETFKAFKLEPEMEEHLRTLSLHPRWHEGYKDEVMLDALRLKFAAGNKMAERLLLTEEVELLEWAPWDAVWGTGPDGKGENRLGKLLMQVRAELRK